ncbi:MAG: hypothetical protein ACIAQZ_16700 [Sedimentisphaeraceae bacterium JB056]
MRFTMKFLALSALICILTGCMGNSSRKNIKDYYMFDAARDNSNTREVAIDQILIVDRFEVAKGFDSNSLIYFNSQGKIETDPYRRYLSDKGQMLSDLTADWLSDSRIFTITATNNTGISGSLRLKGVIKKIYADMQNSENKQAVLEVKVFLVSNTDRKPVFWKEYNTAYPIEDDTAKAVVKATDKTISIFLTQLEEDLSQLEL